MARRVLLVSEQQWACRLRLADAIWLITGWTVVQALC